MKVYVVLFNEEDYDTGVSTSVAEVFFSRKLAEKYVKENTSDSDPNWYNISEKEVKE